MDGGLLEVNTYSNRVLFWGGNLGVRGRQFLFGSLLLLFGTLQRVLVGSLRVVEYLLCVPGTGYYRF